MSELKTPVPFLTVAAVAMQLGVAEDQVLSWIHRAELRAIDVSKNRSRRPRWRIKPEDLESFLATRYQTEKPQAKPKRRKKQDERVIQFFK